MKSLKLTKRQAVQLSVFCSMIPSQELSTVGELKQITDLAENFKKSALSYWDRDVQFAQEATKMVKQIDKQKKAGKSVDKLMTEYEASRGEFEAFAATEGVVEIAVEVDSAAIELLSKLFDKYGTKTSFPKDEILKINTALNAN